MADIKVTFQAVTTLAIILKDKNSKINCALDSMQSSVNANLRSWSGSAASTAKSRFSTIGNTYRNPRSEEINNFAVFLRQNVAPGYQDAESKQNAKAQRFL